MRLVTASALLIAAGSSLAQTQVPHAFQSGQPARASEVNDNFSALAGSINEVSTEVGSLDSRLTMLETTGGTGCESGVSSGWLSAHTPTYEYIPTAVGTPITVGGAGWVLFRVPFVEIGSRQPYVLDFPMSDSAQIDLSFNHVKPASSQCAQLMISGFPASAHISDGVTYSWSQPFQGIRSDSHYDISVTIWVGETAITISTGVQLPIPGMDVFLGDGVYDYTALLPALEAPHIDDIITGFDQFIDYLHIDEAP